MGKNSRNVQHFRLEDRINDCATKNRNLAAVATTFAEATNVVTFTEDDDVNEISISISAVTGGAYHDDAYCLIIYDGLNEAAETAMFADAGGAAVDVEYERVHFLDTVHRIFTDKLSRIAFLPSEAVDITILAQ